MIMKLKSNGCGMIIFILARRELEWLPATPAVTERPCPPDQR